MDQTYFDARVEVEGYTGACQDARVSPPPELVLVRELVWRASDMAARRATAEWWRAATGGAPAAAVLARAFVPVGRGANRYRADECRAARGAVAALVAAVVDQ